MKSRFLENLVEHQSVIGKLADSDSKIERAIELIARTLQDECKLMICGNGGSAADSQHIAAEFTGRFINDRDPLAAIALSQTRLLSHVLQMIILSMRCLAVKFVSSVKKAIAFWQYQPPETRLTLYRPSLWQIALISPPSACWGEMGVVY